MLRVSRNPIRRGLSYVGFRVMMALCSKKKMGGITLHHLAAAEDGAVLLQKVQDALEVIRAESAQRMVRISRVIPRVAIVGLDGSYGWYWHDLRACFLDPDYIRAADRDSIAMTIVHEAVHARIRQWGIRMNEQNRPRVERVCTSAELAFARKARLREELILEAERRHALHT